MSSPNPERWWKNPWPWGIAISLTLGLVTTFTARDVRVGIGLLTGLVGLVLTTCVSILLHLEKQQRNMEKLLFAFGERSTLLQTLKALAPYWAEIDKRRHVRLVQMRDALATEFMEYLEQISTDRVVTMRGRRYEWMRSDLSDLREFWVIHVNDLAYWSSAPAQRYLEQQEHAMARGLRIRRVFVCEAEPDLEALRRVVNRQTSLRADVRILAAWRLPAKERRQYRKYWVNRGIAQDCDGNWLLTSRDGRDASTIENSNIEWELLSYKERDVAEAKDGFETLWSLAQNASDFFQANPSPPAP